MKEKLNITDSRNGAKADGQATYLILTTKNVDNTLLRDNFYEALPYGMIVTLVGFGTLTNVHGHDISSLTKPFDFYIWAFLILSTISLCLFCMIVFKLTSK